MRETKNLLKKKHWNEKKSIEKTSDFRMQCKLEKRLSTDSPGQCEPSFLSFSRVVSITSKNKQILCGNCALLSLSVCSFAWMQNDGWRILNGKSESVQMLLPSNKSRSPTYAWIYYIFACPHLSTWPRCHSYHTLFRVIILIFHLFEMLPCYWQLLSLTVKVGPLSLEFVRTFWCQSRCTVAVIFNIRFSNPNKHRHALSHLCRSSKHMTMAKSKVVISSTFFFRFLYAAAFIFFFLWEFLTCWNLSGIRISKV